MLLDKAQQNNQQNIITFNTDKVEKVITETVVTNMFKNKSFHNIGNFDTFKSIFSLKASIYVYTAHY